MREHHTSLHRKQEKPCVLLKLIFFSQKGTLRQTRIPTASWVKVKYL